MAQAPRARALRLIAARLLPVAFACAGAVLAGQTVGRDPRMMLPLLAFAAILALPAAVARWRMRRLLLSGDVERVIAVWEGAQRGLTHRDTTGPLLRATAYAAYGWIDSARRSLARAGRGPAWEAALEQRLFVETLLDTFEGDRAAAVRKAQAIQGLPLPPAGPLGRLRVARLRRGIAAFARAFAHESQKGDARALSRAARSSPLVHWAMRYAQAVLAVDAAGAAGKAPEVARLLEGAPAWPRQSAFQSYHEELAARGA